MRKYNYSILKLSLFLIICFTSCKNEENKKTNEEKTTVLTQEKTTVTETNTFVWESELCTNICTFDKSKIKKEELAQTLELIQDYNYLDVDLYPVFKLDDKTESIDVLEKEYKNNRKKIENLSIVNDSFWVSIKKIKLEKLKSEYEIRKTAYNAYYKDISLLKKTNYKKEASIYVDALVSNDSVKMVTAWRKLINEQKSKNGSPEYLEQKFQNQLQSSNCLEYAKMTLFSFGWWNNRIDQNHDKYAILDDYRLYEKFKKLFITVNEQCDEP